MRLAFWNDLIETRCGDGYKTFKAGEKHAALVIQVPWWLAAILRHVITLEKDLQPCRR